MVKGHRRRMGACCAKKSPNENGASRSRLRRASTAAVGQAAGAARSTMRRMSRMVGASMVGDNGATLDPATNISELLGGQWREHANPDKERRLNAMKLPYMLKKLFMKAVVSMEMKIKEGGIVVTLNLGFVKTVSTLNFDSPDKRETAMLGLNILTITQAKRGAGGGYAYTVTETKNGATSVINAELTPEVKGNAVYCTDISHFKLEKEPEHRFECVWKRVGDATVKDRRLFVVYQQGRMRETAAAAPEKVELTLADGP